MASRLSLSRVRPSLPLFFMVDNHTLYMLTCTCTSAMYVVQLAAIKIKAEQVDI
jgi:hypothetical protein